MLFCFGGEKGIRTLVGGLLQTRFPVVRLRPAQPSLRAGRYSPSRGTHTRDLCILPHIAGFVKRFSEKCGEEVDRNLLYSRSVLAPCGSPGRFRLTGMPVAPTAMVQNFLSGNVFPDLQPARSRKETHSGVGSAVLPLRVRTRVRFFCAGAR